MQIKLVVVVVVVVVVDNTFERITEEEIGNLTLEKHKNMEEQRDKCNDWRQDNFPQYCYLFSFYTGNRALSLGGHVEFQENKKPRTQFASGRGLPRKTKLFIPLRINMAAE